MLAKDLANQRAQFTLPLSHENPFKNARKTYCAKCDKHTPHKVTQYKAGKPSLFAQGKRRYDRKQRGFGGQTKPVFHKKAKTTKKIVLRMECSCGFKKQQVLKRCKRFELGGEKKKKNEANTGLKQNSSNNLLGNNNIHISSSSPPTSAANNANRPRLQSTPIPPSHPLPAVPPSRMSVPVGSPTIRHPPPPPTTQSLNNSTTSASTTPTYNNNRATSPANTPDYYMSPHLTNSYDDNNSHIGNYSKRPLSMRIPPPPPSSQKKNLVRAVWDCVSEADGDLEFAVGDIITVVTKDDESGWWVGTLNGRTGSFPANYVTDI
eukprot:gene8221-9668_t